MAAKKKIDIVPPKPDIWDYLYQANKAALTVVPPLATFYEMVIVPPFQKRTIKFMQSVVVKCQEYEHKLDEFKPENLVNNELFQSAFNYSARIAVQTHQKEKLEILQNALLNTVIMNDIDENYKLLFFSYIETITPLHISVLNFYKKIRHAQILPNTIYDKQFEKFHSEMSNKGAILNTNLFTQVCKDLELKNLLYKGSNKRTRQIARVNDPWDWMYITDDGSKFLKFISDPEKPFEDIE
ncbi:MAG: hypothetical protein OQK63_05940 [Ignavibacteriaceae bacterium]|nr:hypothetical protein [Ignavibacteriaceae bacterium]